MKKLIFLFILVLIHIIWMYRSKSASPRYLIVSFFIMAIPFQVAFPIKEFILNSNSGTLGATLALLLPLAMALVFIPYFRLSKTELNLRYNMWMGIILILLIISFLNPHNYSKIGTLVWAIFIGSHVLLFKILISSITYAELIKGIFNGLFYLCIVQVILAICFPLLGISAVTNLFYEGAGEWATRMGTRPGAVGVFTHPGNLALFTVFASIFFTSCFLVQYKRKAAIYILILNSITVFLTYSRTSYLVFVFSLFFVYFMYKNAEKKLFSMGNVIKFVVPTSLILLWLVFYSPLSALFLNSDADEMYTARLMHWYMAFETFQTNPIFGVGLNAHLEYFFRSANALETVDINNEFLIKNPIHNIHLIVLVETGFIGFLLWIAFLVSNVTKNKQFVAVLKQKKYSPDAIIMPLSCIGIILAYSIYGLTGWAPFSPGILPFFIFFTFFSIKYRRRFMASL